MTDAPHPASNPLPLEALAAYLRSQALAGGGAIDVRQLAGGQSNPTYFVGTDRGRFVLRKKPAGAVLASAHAVDREYRVMKALHGTDVPVPQMLAYCDDASVLGTPFYVMAYLDGRVLMDQALPGCTVAERGAMYREMNRVIAALHTVDVAAVGLADYGKPGNYFARQIARWSRQTLDSTVPIPGALRQLIEWLPQHIPSGDETTLVHGDYRLDNLVFHPTEPRVIGVLDWELSTLGHPLADLSYQCMGWHIPPSLWRGIGGLDLAVLGIPDERTYRRWYAVDTGRDTVQHWDFYLAYNLFRLAAIMQGIAQRAAAGNAAAADAVQTGQKAGPIAEIGWQCALRCEAEGG